MKPSGASLPKAIFTLPVPNLQHFVVSQDGERFLLNIPQETDAASGLTVLLDWTPGS